MFISVLSFNTVNNVINSRTRTDSDGYIEKLHITPANVHECNHFEPLLESIASGATVYADKGYDSKANQEHLQSKQLSDGIMRKAKRGQSLSEEEKQRNKELSKTRYVVEQSFGTLHRKFRYARASYFGLLKVTAQSHLKAICLNLLKAADCLFIRQSEGIKGEIAGKNRRKQPKLYFIVSAIRLMWGFAKISNKLLRPTGSGSA